MYDFFKLNKNEQKNRKFEDFFVESFAKLIFLYWLVVPQSDENIRRRNSERNLNRPEKPLEPTRPLRAKPTTPDPGGPKTIGTAKNEGSNVLKIVKKTVASTTPELNSAGMQIMWWVNELPFSLVIIGLLQNIYPP